MVSCFDAQAKTCMLIERTEPFGKELPETGRAEREQHGRLD